MERPRPPTLTFTERLAALDGRGKKATRASREANPTIKAQEDTPEVAPQPEGSTGPGDLDEFLTVPEVARILRFTERHVRALIDQGEIASHQFGTAVRISRADLRAYIARCRRSR